MILAPKKQSVHLVYTVSIVFTSPFRAYRTHASDIDSYRGMIILRAGTYSVLL
jgi:hypothetical protein